MRESVMGVGPEDPDTSDSSNNEVDPEESHKGTSRDEEILRDRPPHH